MVLVLLLLMGTNCQIIKLLKASLEMLQDIFFLNKVTTLLTPCYCADALLINSLKKKNLAKICSLAMFVYILLVSILLYSHNPYILPIVRKQAITQTNDIITSM